ncbi:MAG: NUDIX domain-containing protein [Methanomassiliicoccales archaeon]
MRTVYGVGIEGERFLMVFNPARGGWEMPGGHVEEGETPKEAVIREFREEAGLIFHPEKRFERGEVTVFAGRLGGPAGRGEMTWELFKELPGELAFPEEEYREVIDWATR